MAAPRGYKARLLLLLLLLLLLPPPYVHVTDSSLFHQLLNSNLNV
jgi:hypothetical protein